MSVVGRFQGFAAVWSKASDVSVSENSANKFSRFSFWRRFRDDQLIINAGHSLDCANFTGYALFHLS